MTWDYNENLQNYQPEEIFNDLATDNSQSEQNYLIEPEIIENEIQHLYDFFLLDFIGFVGLFCLFCLVSWSNQKKLKPKKPLILPYYQPTKPPCAKCVYFDNNPYLKCALHPVEAATKEAINCLDYKRNIS